MDKIPIEIKSQFLPGKLEVEVAVIGFRFLVVTLGSSCHTAKGITNKESSNKKNMGTSIER